jgi:hypothetical protein
MFFFPSNFVLILLEVMMFDEVRTPDKYNQESVF